MHPHKKTFFKHKNVIVDILQTRGAKKLQLGKCCYSSKWEKKKVVSGVLFIRFQGPVIKILFILLNLNMCYEVVVISIWGWYILRGHTYKCVLSS